MAETLGLAYVKKEIQLQNNLIGTGFADAPPSGKSRVSYTGEIVSAIGFDQPKLSIIYQIHVPELWLFDDFNNYDTLGMSNDLDEINKRESITQYSNAHVVDYNHQRVYESSFSFPFDLQFIHDTTEESSERPHLLFQVNSLDSWNRHRIEGYGALQFPSEEGSHEFMVQTWKPRGSFQNELHSFFLGGSVRVIELEDIIQSYKINEKGERDIINRFDFETEDSGEILVRLNCISHDYDRKKINREKYDIEREKQEQEIVKRINAERVKQIKRYRKKIKDEIQEEEMVTESERDSRYYDYDSYSRESRDYDRDDRDRGDFERDNRATNRDFTKTEKSLDLN
jgi:Meckel syndrome type 1 protein